jgi:putative thioredoxin
MTPENIIEVNELNFEYEVINFSQNTPVLVDFWAEWCQPCKVLGPILEKVVNESHGGIRLAKVNVDQNPNLALRYNVRSIPTVKAFIEGRVEAEMVGVQPESRLRDFISKLNPPSPVELEIRKGINLLLSHEWDEAEKVLRSVLEQKSESAVASLGLAKALLAKGQAEEALRLLDEMPASRESSQADILRPYAVVLQQYENNELPEESDLDILFSNNIRLAKMGRFAIAIDGILDTLRQDKKYRTGIAHKVILGILEILGDEDPQTRDYRSELASILF